MIDKWIYNFGGSETEGDASMRNLLGGKGANLAEMCKIGLPVPPGFTITTDLCSFYYENSSMLPENFTQKLQEAIQNLEIRRGLKFGATDSQPLLVSVRSGSRVSMPGMMDTVLNLGLNDQTVKSLAKSTNDERFAWDSYRRFIQMFGDVVMGVPHHHFEEILELAKQDIGVLNDSELETEHLQQVTEMFKKKIKEEAGISFPENVHEQLSAAIIAVLKSWMTHRAVTYRKMNDICSSFGTAVNVQSMVFGNMGETSATGVAFTRDPSTGEKFFYGEYLINAQGEDVVAGIRTPMPINQEMGKAHGEKPKKGEIVMEEKMPQVYSDLVQAFAKLENHYLDMQDIEFTVEKGQLWILQTRSGKRSAQASIKIAHDFVVEGKISRQEALCRINPASLEQLLHPTLDPKARIQVIEKALPASPGAASGIIVFSSEEAEEMAKKGVDVILVRIETSPEDIHGMYASKGILTNRGGMTSHAAVVARGMGKCCVVGASGIKIDYDAKIINANGVIVKAGEFITINGSTGEVILGEVPRVEPQLSGEFAEIMKWASEIKKMSVRTNAENVRDAETAMKFGAEGIGLCRTEHMFFEEDRIKAVREMIMAVDSEGRKEALAKILPMQKQDFLDLFEVMKGKPINIRLLDPPLHEFLPSKEEEILKFCESMSLKPADVKARLSQLEEFNPMLGNRGCRLGICFPEIYECQARAIFEALAESQFSPNVEIMIPLIISETELQILRAQIEEVAKIVEIEKNVKLANFQIGTMIELPRAALKAAEIANFADYFSFGTNDLTQTTMGISRDDSGSFMGKYVEKKILKADPFVELDESGVGQLIKIAVENARKTKPEIKLGICGEHGGEPKAVAFFDSLDFDYVSCSPYRVPIAKLAAAISFVKRRK